MEACEFEALVREQERELIEHRRWLHRHAELSFEEYETTAYIEKTLRSIGVTEIERPTKTGLIAHIHGEKAGKARVVGLRADIDALPITEECKLPFASQNAGVMHACGHDGHAAIALSLAKCLLETRADFCGEARLIFQHAEELPPGGAIELARAGAARNADAMLSLHLSSNFPTGVFGVKSGVLTANVDRFDVHIQGRGGHCAFPEQCVDPLLCASEIVCALQSIVSRRIPAKESAVLSVCRFQAGSAYNIIPESAELSASVRSFGSATRRLIENEARRICENTAAANGAECTFSWLPGYPSVVNDCALNNTAERAIKTRFGEERLLEIGCLMPGEDFPYFTEHCPGFFVELGTRCAEKNCDKPHHNPLYCMDEDALLYGLQYELDMLRLLLVGTATECESAEKR